MIFDEKGYMIQIILYSIFLFTFGITYSKFIDGFFSEPFKNKSKLRIVGEIYFEILCLVLGIYIIRRTLDNVMDTLFGKMNNPEKYALLVLGSPMFAQDLHLIRKIKYVWKDI